MKNLSEREIEHKQKVLDAINSSRRPLNISEVARKANVHWETSKKHIVSLESEKLIRSVARGKVTHYEKLAGIEGSQA